MASSRKRSIDSKQNDISRFCENLPLLMYNVDFEGRIIDCNNLVVETLGYKNKNQLIGKHLVTTIYAPSSREKAKKLFSIWEKIGKLNNEELQIITKQGKLIDVLLNVETIHDKNGKPLYSISIQQDITKRKMIEEKLRHQTEHLQELVEERTNSLLKSYREIRALNESIVQRLVEKTNQIDNISRMRGELRRLPDISTGLDMILDSALNDFGMINGLVLTINSRDNLANVRDFRSKKEGVELKDSYPLDARFVELRALKDNKKGSGIIEKFESSILKTASIHFSPIHFGKETYGALILGSEEKNILDESSVEILGLYAELVSTVFETHSLTITPMKEAAEGAKKRFELEFANSYITKDNVNQAFEIFADNVLSGIEGVCITREYPVKVREKYKLEKTPIVWLTEEKTEGQMTVHSLQDLSILIGGFLEKVNRGIVLLDGVEYLITNHGFESFLRFLQLNRSRFEQNDSILIIPLLERALDKKEMGLIERETKPFQVA